ncbi:MarR family transcriptional regulator [Rhizobium sp. BK602]|uniref:MarR family transcriptional regulator n=1 Tax=Rhizobium sp. BK602 TaxID=2586986 RepID=UPI00161456A2|nr:DNA-binding MarR family transcriptional regulator [Rhizobium sp. BK602]
MQLSRLICGVNRKLEQAMEAHLRPLGLSIEQYRILEALDEHDGISMGELAAKVFVDSPTLTKIIDKMVASSDVYRAPDAKDRRKVLIFRSNKGKDIFLKLQGLSVKAQQDVMDILGQKEARDLSNLLYEVFEKLDQ